MIQYSCLRKGHLQGDFLITANVIIVKERTHECRNLSCQWGCIPL